MAKGEGLLALLASPKGDSKGEADMGKEAKAMALRDFWAAKDDDDVDAGVDAFKRLYDACAAEHGKDDGEDY